MNCIKQIDKIMHNPDSETKSFPLYQLDKISVAIPYLVVYIVKKNLKAILIRTHVKLTTRDTHPPVHIDAQDV